MCLVQLQSDETRTVFGPRTATHRVKAEQVNLNSVVNLHFTVSQSVLTDLTKTKYVLQIN